MRTSKPAVLALVTVLGAALCVTACSRGSSGGSSSGGTGGGRGITDTSVKVVGIVALTSPVGGTPGGDVGALARFTRANAEGGIHGRKIDFTGTLDDGSNGAKNLDLATKAVKQDNVFAIVPMMGSGFLPASSDLLTAEKVPSVGYGYMPGQCAARDSYGFGFSGCIQKPSSKVEDISDTKPIVDHLGAGVRVAIVSTDNQTGIDGLNRKKSSFAKSGATVVYAKANVPATGQVDFTPFVQAVMTSDGGKPPQLVSFTCNLTCVVGVTAGLKAAGYTGAVNNAVTYAPGLLETSPDLARSLDGSYINTQVLPLEFGGTAVEQFKKDVEAVKPGFKVTIGTMVTYYMADVFVQMLEAVGRDLTPERFGQVVNGGFTYTPEGEPRAVGPVTFPQGHDDPATCGALVQIKGTAYVPVTPLKCFPNVPKG